MASLLKEFKGKIDLIYIDPPFDVGGGFHHGRAAGQRQGNRWHDSYLHMMFERLTLIKELLSEKGSIYVDVGWYVSHCTEAVFADVFGRDRFLNKVIWERQTAHSDTTQGSGHMGRFHDVIFLFTKGEAYTWNVQYTPYSEEYSRDYYKLLD